MAKHNRFGLTRRDRVVVATVVAILATTIGTTVVVVRSIGPFTLKLPKFAVPGPGPDASPRELAVAATTVPPTPRACGAFHDIRSIGTATGRVDLDIALQHRDFPHYKAALTLLLIAFDRDLARAIPAASGPLRDHLALARGSVDAGLAAIRSARVATDYDPVTHAEAGWSQLEIADQLLGASCGGGLAPPPQDPFASMNVG